MAHVDIFKLTFKVCSTLTFSLLSFCISFPHFHMLTLLVFILLFICMGDGVYRKIQIMCKMVPMGHLMIERRSF